MTTTRRRVRLRCTVCDYEWATDSPVAPGTNTRRRCSRCREYVKVEATLPGAPTRQDPRICAHPGCTTRLNSYATAEGRIHCYPHDKPPTPPPTPTPTERPRGLNDPHIRAAVERGVATLRAMHQAGQTITKVTYNAARPPDAASARSLARWLGGTSWTKAVAHAIDTATVPNQRR